MRTKLLATLDSRTQSALIELRDLIQSRYPTASFEISRGHDEPINIHLDVTVDIDDPFEVLDMVLDRLLEFQIDERIPIHVIPVRTPERIEAALRAESGVNGYRLAPTLRTLQSVPVIDPGHAAT